MFSSLFYQKVFFCQFVDKKIWGLMPKYYLLAGDTNQVSNISLTSDEKINKQNRLNIDSHPLTYRVNFNH